MAEAKSTDQPDVGLSSLGNPASVDPTEAGYLPRDDIALGGYRVMVRSAARFGPRLGPSPFDTLYVPFGTL